MADHDSKRHERDNLDWRQIAHNALRASLRQCRTARSGVRCVLAHLSVGTQSVRVLVVQLGRLKFSMVQHSQNCSTPRS